MVNLRQSVLKRVFMPDSCCALLHLGYPKTGSISLQAVSLSSILDSSSFSTIPCLRPLKGSSFLTPGQKKVIRGLLTQILPRKSTQVTKAERRRIEAFYLGHRIADLPARGTEGIIL